MTGASVATVRNFVDGRFVDGSDAYELASPVDGRPATVVAIADAALVDAAVRSARSALAGEWGRTTVSQRVAILRRIADRIEQRADEFVATEVRDTGRPTAIARTLDVARAVANFRAFADIISTQGTDAHLTDLGDGGRAINYVSPKPLGVVAVIVPWNLPLLLLTWKVAPALACGNAVVVKPSENTPSSASLLADVMNEVGVAPGVYNVVNGFGPGSTGEALTCHPGIDGVTFTGESATGAAIMAAVSPSVRPVSFELGGKNAAVVFADADLGAAIAGVGRSVFSNTGQICLCTERVYVQRPIFDEFVAGLVGYARALRCGSPEDPATTLGPLISHEHRDKVLSYFAIAEREGAEVLVGGGIPDVAAELAGGAWIEPTLWTSVEQSARIVREEVFGPVAAILPFDSDEQALALANDTDYGLASAVWTTDLRRGHTIASQMRVGVSWVNTWFLRDLRTPFGGIGRSGVGREGGRHSLDFYSEATNVCVQT